MKKKNIPNNPPSFENKDWSNFLSYETHREYNCGEKCDDYCHYAVITEVEVKTNIKAIDYFFTKTNKSLPNGLVRILSSWFHRKHFEKISWGFEADCGYYGQELNKVTIESDGGFFNLLEGFNSLVSNKEKLEFLLNLEYGSVLPAIKEIEDWQLKLVDISDVNKSFNTSLNKSVLDEYTRYIRSFFETYTFAGMTDFSYGSIVKNLAPLCLLKADGKYQVVDGRHRFEAITQEYIMPPTRPTKTNKKKTPEGIFTPSKLWIICPMEK